MISRTAAPIIFVEPQEHMSPGWTDGTNIFMRDDLSEREKRTLLRHEQAHLWLDHFPRGKRELRKRQEWENATELEIARAIYDAKDIATITAPRSRIRGGVLPNTFGVPVNIDLAEDIYDWFIANPLPEEKQNRPSCCKEDTSANNDDKSKETSQQQAVTPDEVRRQLDQQQAVTPDEVRRQLDQNEARATAMKESHAKTVAQRPPSLASLLDAALRTRIERESTYRRPSRRAGESDIILRGRATISRSPLVEIYVDRSGSFDPEKTATSQMRIKAILTRYRASIRCDVMYFGNETLFVADPMYGDGNTPYDLVLEHIAQTRPHIAVILTDDDPAPNTLPKLSNHTNIILVPIGATHTSLRALLPQAREVVA